MKKLILAAAAILVGGAYASSVFDYKASVKYVDFKKVKGVWVKVVKSTTITGYLVTPIACPCTIQKAPGVEPGYLVVTSPGAKKFSTDSIVKILPANLLVDAWSQKKISGKKMTLEAQGYLFAGIGKAAVPAADGSPDYTFGDPTTAATQYLFGEPNQVINGVFVEAWLDAAGFGKATYGDTKQAKCCVKTGGTSYCLQSLAGSVIGGSFTCRSNGTDDNFAHVDGYFEEFLCQGWNLATVVPAAGDQPEGDNGELEMGGTLMNVVSGTWSIKANTTFIETATTTVKELVIATADKLDGKKVTFDLNTFDASTGETFAGKFVEAWIDAAAGGEEGGEEGGGEVEP